MTRRFAILVFLLTSLIIANINAEWAEPIKKPTDEKFYKQMDKLITKVQAGKIGERVANGYVFNVYVYQSQLEKYLNEKRYYYSIINRKIDGSTNYEWFVTRLVVNPNISYAEYNRQQAVQKEMNREKNAEFNRNLGVAIVGTATLAYKTAGVVMKKAIDAGFVTEEALTHPTSSSNSSSSANTKEDVMKDENVKDENETTNSSKPTSSDIENGNINLPKCKKKQSSGTYSPMGLQGNFYSYWVEYDEDDIKTANIYGKIDGTFYAIDFAVNWYKYDSYENAVKAWYIYQKWGIIMKAGKLN